MIVFYQVEVFSRGVMISAHRVEAPDALSAINLVEAQYGEPPQFEYKTIHHEDGTKERALIVFDWHGYTFMARRAEIGSP